MQNDLLKGKRCQWQVKNPQNGQVKIPQFGVSVVCGIIDWQLHF